MDQTDLLRKFVETRDEAAFRQLVDRYVSLVWSAARRQTRDAHLAEDVTQAVFIMLFRNAGKIRDGSLLGGWLIKAARLASLTALRQRDRQHRHEKKAAIMKHALTSTERCDWESLEPLVDEAMGRLSEAERSAMVLRFLEDKSFAEVAAALGISEPAAMKRVSRATAKMRSFFARRGVFLSAAALASALAENALQRPPNSLAERSAQAALVPAESVAAAIAEAAGHLSTYSLKLAIAAALMLVVVVPVAAFIPAHLFRPAVSETVSKPAVSPATLPAGDIIKVGWIVSEQTAQHLRDIGSRNDYEHVLYIRPRLRDPQLDLYAVIESGDLSNPRLAALLAQNFVPGHVIDAENPTALHQFQVIVCSRVWHIRQPVVAAIEQAVREGTGLFAHVTVSRPDEAGYSDTIHRLLRLGDAQYFLQRGIVQCEIRADHPLLASLGGSLVGRKININTLNGWVGTLDGKALIVAPQITAASGQMMDYCALSVSQIGNGRIVYCGWDSIPPDLVTATNGRFYIHCVQWAAKREIH